MPKPEYLGDSVYIEPWDMSPYSFKLYLDNGMGHHTEIYMEDTVVLALEKYLTDVKKELGIDV